MNNRKLFNPTRRGLFFGIFNVGGRRAIWPLTLFLVIFGNFSKKWHWFKNSYISTHFYIKTTPGIILWSKTFQIPKKGRAKMPYGAQILVSKNFGSKISHRKVLYLKIDWNQFVFEEKRIFLENGQKLRKILY